MPNPQIATVDDRFAVLASGYRRYEDRATGDDVDLLTHSLQAAHGGPLTAAQQRRFERRRHSHDAVVLRSADDGAHDLGRVVPSLLSWRPVLDSIADAALRDRQLSLQALELMAVWR